MGVFRKKFAGDKPDNVRNQGGLKIGQGKRIPERKECFY